MLSFAQFVPENGHVIGELACGHEGDPQKLRELIDCVSEGGAHVIKFQIFVPSERATPDHAEWQIFNDLFLSENHWMDAVKYARSKELIVFADIFGEESFLLAKNLGVDGYKIHSEDLLNSDLIAKVASEKKITVIGVGGARRIEIYNLLNFLEERGLRNNIILMTGVQAFPTPVDAHSLDEVCDLVNKYSSSGVKVGFSDHVSGDLFEESIILPLMALAKGAVVIEKHVTIDRAKKWEDYESALGKENFKTFVGHVKNLAPLLGKIGPFNKYEKQYRRTFKKSPVAAHDLSAGDILASVDLKYVKHAHYSIPLSGVNVTGEKIKTPIRKGDVMRLSSIEAKVGAIIVARNTSERLPGKATRVIQGRETIALLIDRVKRCKNVDCIVLATSTDGTDDVLETIARREGVLPFRGSLENLSLRFYEAAKHYKIDQIVRITGDDILRDEIMIDKAVEQHLASSCNVTLMKNMPYGTASEIFSLNVLKTILKTAVVPENTEYLEWYLENDRYFNVNYVESSYQYDPRIRLTLDYEEDFLFFSRVFEHFSSLNPSFILEDVIAYLSENSDVVNINEFKTAKYTQKDLDVSLGI